MIRHPAPEMWTEDDVLVRRVGAILVDTVLVVLPAMVLLGRETQSGLVLFHLLFLVWFAYGTWFEWLWGQTLGKMLVGIVVVKENGSQCDFSAAVWRNVIRFFDLLLYYGVGFVAMMFTDRRQRIGDYIAKTVVLRTA